MEFTFKLDSKKLTYDIVEKEIINASLSFIQSYKMVSNHSHFIDSFSMIFNNMSACILTFESNQVELCEYNLEYFDSLDKFELYENFTIAFECFPDTVTGESNYTKMFLLLSFFMNLDGSDCILDAMDIDEIFIRKNGKVFFSNDIVVEQELGKYKHLFDTLT